MRRLAVSLGLAGALSAAAAFSRHVPAQSPAAGLPVFNVVSFGARNDGSASATSAFHNAIAAAKKAGGGTIFVPAGRYISGPIVLFSNMTLQLDAGATITFPVAPLPFVQGRYLGVEALVPMPLVGGDHVENVAVSGQGTLVTGDYAAWSRAYGQPVASARDNSGNANGPLWDHLLKALNAGQPVSWSDYRAAAAELRPSFICFSNAKNILIEGVHLVGGPAFVVHLLYSENATVRNAVINAYPGPHANGIVVDSSRFVRIADDFVNTGDDGIVIKAGKDADGLRVSRPSENVAITNCTVQHAHGAVVIGSETSGGIRNVVASNIEADGTENGIRIKSRRGRGGVVQNVRFDNWTMRNVGTGIVITTYYVMGGEGATAEEKVSRRTPVFRNIGISNVTIAGARQVADIEGLPEMPLRGVRLLNVIGEGRAGLDAESVDNLELHEVKIAARQSPAYRLRSITNLLLDDVGANSTSASASAIHIENCPGAVLRNNPTPHIATQGKTQ